jgi:hypothetical protein
MVGDVGGGPAVTFRTGYLVDAVPSRISPPKEPDR